MSATKLTRRDALSRTGLLLGAVVAGPKFQSSTGAAETAPTEAARPFRYSLNMGTLRGFRLGIVKEIEIAAQAGYDGIEPWVDTLQTYLDAGGTLADLRQRSADAGLTVEGAIGFPEWIVEDPGRRAKGLERAKREMDWVAHVGGRRFAAPPAGATDLPRLELGRMAERYRAVLELGDTLGLVPQLELWGFSKNLSQLGECVGVAVETGHPKACVLVDVFHLYKGGSDFHGMRLLGPGTLQVMHMNDYPAAPPREKIDDSYRVYPGDGTAPLTELLRALRATGGPKVLSLELFNREYWKQEPLAVARTGLAKMKAAVAKAQP